MRTWLLVGGDSVVASASRIPLMASALFTGV